MCLAYTCIVCMHLHREILFISELSTFHSTLFVGLSKKEKQKQKTDSLNESFISYFNSFGATKIL